MYNICSTLCALCFKPDDIHVWEILVRFLRNPSLCTYFLLQTYQFWYGSHICIMIWGHKHWLPQTSLSLGN
jgi:hypothetical protein